jgi:4-hydroxyphenylacetate 3-hydroxylase, reductase component
MTSPALPHVADPGFDTRSFRQALGQYATGVAVVTARDGDGRPVGMTINSFASVSLDPPLILWSVQLDASQAEAFRAAERFAICVLGADQELDARRFAGAEADRFPTDPALVDAHGVPLIAGARAQFSCRRWAVYPGGDHDIIVGEVDHFTVQAGAGLLFHQGRFARSDA